MSTKLTPALKIKQAMLLMKEGYDEDEKLTINITYSEQQKHNELFLTENGVYQGHKYCLCPGVLQEI